VHPPRALLPPTLERRPPPHRTANPRALPRCSRSPAGRAGREAPGSGTSCVDLARLRRARLRRLCRWHGEVGELGEAEQRRGAGEEEEVVMAVAALQDPWLGAGRARLLEFARPLRLPLEWLAATDGEESSWLLG
jgi:hypothetical protein